MAQMKFKGASGGFSSLLKEGYKHFGGLEEAILKNIEACKGLAAITRTSYGPNGMNKLVVNHLEKLFVTSDAATMVQELEVAHPAAKMLARAALMQVQELGDGSNFVVTFAGELLTQAEHLLRIGVHPAEVAEGYKKAMLACEAALGEMVCSTVGDARDPAVLAAALTPVLAAKQYGYEALLARLVADACVAVMPPASSGKPPSVTVDNVRVAKLIGGTVSDSQVVRGVLVLHDTQGSIKHAAKAKIAVFGCSIEASSTETKGTVVIKNADELKAYNKGEERMMEEAIKGIADSGASVVVAGGAVSEIALHYLEKYKLMAVKVLSKFELRRLCKAVGATALVRVGPPMPDELGYADAVSVQELSSKLVTVFRQDDGGDSGVATIVLRGSTVSLLEDMERAVDDAVNAARNACRDGRMVPGAGAAEMECAARCAALAAGAKGLDGYALGKFGEAMEVFARTLAENAGLNATEVVSALYAKHAAGATGAGVDVEAAAGSSGVLESAPAAGVVDSLAVKLSALRLASEAAMTVLKVDSIIMAKQAGGPKVRPQAGADSQDD